MFSSTAVFVLSSADTTADTAADTPADTPADTAPETAVLAGLAETFESVVEIADPTPERVVAQIRACGAPRWLLVGLGSTADVVGAVVDEVLPGRARVFGLAGVVLAQPYGARWVADQPLAGADRAVPTRTLGDGGADPVAAIARFWAEHAGRGPVVPADFVAVLASERVSARTRGIHARRVLADDPAYAPSVLTSSQLATLRVVADRVVPQDGDPTTWLDLAARVDAQLAAGAGDGWRHVDLPPDVEAYRAALDELADLAELDVAHQDAALTDVAAEDRVITGGTTGGSTDGTTGALTAGQLALWFQDACNDLVRQWLAHPATMARIGYDGLANGGDEDFTGFTELAADAREPWEPVLLGLPGAVPPSLASTDQETAR